MYGQSRDCCQAQNVILCGSQILGKEENNFPCSLTMIMVIYLRAAALVNTASEASPYSPKHKDGYLFRSCVEFYVD